MSSEDSQEFLEEKQKLNFEELLFRFRYPILFILVGLILLGIGFIYFKGGFSDGNKTEVLENTTPSQNTKITVEVAGVVEKPGVYQLIVGDRVEDLLIAAGGISVNADRVWMEKYLNRATKLVDGQKIYIPPKGSSEISQNTQSQVLSAKNSGVDQSASSNFSVSGEGLVNINTSDLKTLDSLPGIGPVYAQKIIEQRPYSTIEELASKKVIPQKTYEKIKLMISVY